MSSRVVPLPDVIVVGGGAVGCMVGYELVKAGARVTVIERDGIATHASGFSLGGLFPTQGAGIPGPVLEPARLGYRLHQALYGHLFEESGVDYCLRRTDQLVLAATEAELEAVTRERAWETAEGFEAELIEPPDLYRLEPGLGPGFAGGLLQRTAMELDSYRFTLALSQATERRGGRILTAEATAITTESGVATGVLTRSGEHLTAGAVVLATGPWAGSPPAVVIRGGDAMPLPKLPVRPFKGEILRLRWSGRSAGLRLNYKGRSLGRKPDGLVWVGATEEDRGFDEHATEAARDWLIAGAVRMVPGIASAEVVQHTACLRPLAVDSLPIIGPVESVARGLFAAAAAGKKGILLCPAIAKMTAALAAGRSGDCPVPAALSTARFGL